MNELIIIIINEGFVEEVMRAAREAGATGGTVFNARGTAHCQNELRFLGLNLNPDKEIILILTSIDCRNKIMDSVKKCAGLTTKASGIVFSLPVSSVLPKE